MWAPHCLWYSERRNSSVKGQSRTKMLVLLPGPWRMAKFLRADNLKKKDWQNNPICKLCNSEQENPMPMYKDCFYIKRVCTVIKGWWNLSLQVNANLRDSVHKCWRRWTSKIEKDKRLFLVEYMERKKMENISTWRVTIEGDRLPHQRGNTTTLKSVWQTMMDIYFSFKVLLSLSF